MTQTRQFVESKSSCLNYHFNLATKRWMTSTPKIRNGIQQFTIDMRTTKYTMIYWQEEEKSNTGCHMFLSIFIFTIHMFLFIAHYVGLTSNVYLWASQECTSQKLVTDAYFCVNRNKLSPCHLLLKRACTFFFAQCTMKLKNRMHWKWQTKTLNPKRGAFFGWKFGYIIITF